jgi:hypothetical protein
MSHRRVTIEIPQVGGAEFKIRLVKMPPASRRDRKFGRRAAAKLLIRDEARRIAANIAKAPETTSGLLWPGAGRMAIR